jgi:RNA polymerase-binding protein DksA
MKHLNSSDLEALALRLDVLKRRVQHELEREGSHVESGMRARDHEVHSHADDAEADRLANVHFAEVEVDRKALREIEQAQQRMATGQYGLCVECGEEIPVEWLLAQTTAIRCTACQTKAEDRHGR